MATHLFRPPPPLLVTAGRFTLNGIEPNQPFSLLCAYWVRTSPQSWRDTQTIAAGLDVSWQADRLALALRADGTVRLASPIAFEEIPRYGRTAGPLTMFIDPRGAAAEVAEQLLADKHMTTAMRDAIVEWAGLYDEPEISAE